MHLSLAVSPRPGTGAWKRRLAPVAAAFTPKLSLFLGQSVQAGLVPRIILHASVTGRQPPAWNRGVVTKSDRWGSGVYLKAQPLSRTICPSWLVPRIILHASVTGRQPPAWNRGVETKADSHGGGLPPKAKPLSGEIGPSRAGSGTVPHAFAFNPRPGTCRHGSKGLRAALGPTLFPRTVPVKETGPGTGSWKATS